MHRWSCAVRQMTAGALPAAGTSPAMSAPHPQIPPCPLKPAADEVSPLASPKLFKYFGLYVEQAPFMNKFGGYYSSIFWSAMFEPAVRFSTVIVTGFGNDWAVVVLLPGLGLAISVTILTMFDVPTPICKLDKRAEVCITIKVAM